MRNLLKPEYLWRPSQIFRRFTFKQSDEALSLPLPWNCSIQASSSEVLGKCIATQGVYDLPVTEAIVRLTDAGDTAVDVGANIGYMSLVLALSAGPKGRVMCFEPNPEIFPVLRANTTAWKRLPIAPIEVNAVALSDQDGSGTLGFPADYERNHGVASLEAEHGGVPVKLRTLDSIQIRLVSMLKIDVEGHEAAVFAGAQGMLTRKAVRDILFEEHDPYPARSHKLLLRHGYHIFRLTRSTWRPLLLPADAPARQAYLPSNFLATTDPSRALSRFTEWGWRSLSRRIRPTLDASG